MKNLLCNTETEIPEVDNTDIPCDIFYSSECVVMQNLSQTVKNYFNLGDTPTLTEYAEAVALALKDARERIITIENNCCDGGGGSTLLPFVIRLSQNIDPIASGNVAIYQDDTMIYTGNAEQEVFLNVKEGSTLRAEIYPPPPTAFEIEDVAIRNTNYVYQSLLGQGIVMTNSFYNTLMATPFVPDIDLLSYSTSVS